MLTLIVLACLVVGYAAASAPTLPECPGQPNAYPVFTEKPIYLASSKHGKKYIAGNATSNSTFYVVHLYGTPYEMGYAQGELFKKEIPSGISSVMVSIAEMVERQDPKLPKWLVDFVVEKGLPVALQWCYDTMVKYTPKRYLDEMRGLADGANVSHDKIFQVNMLASIIRAQCSIVLANKKATKSSLNGTLIHLRTLDGMGGARMSLTDYAAVIVYHNEDGATFANFGFISFIGSFTGFGEKVGVGEKFWSAGEKYDSWDGEPWTFVMRDMLLQPTMEKAMEVLKKANRTCSIHVSIGGHKTMDGRVVLAAHDQYHVIKDTTVNTTIHPAIDDIVYFDQFSVGQNHTCFPAYLRREYGALTAEKLATELAPMAQTGGLHAAIFDYQHNVAFYSTSRKTFDKDGPIKSYDRQFTRLNMNDLFGEKL